MKWNSKEPHADIENGCIKLFLDIEKFNIYINYIYYIINNNIYSQEKDRILFVMVSYIQANLNILNFLISYILHNDHRLFFILFKMWSISYWCINTLFLLIIPFANQHNSKKLIEWIRGQERL